MAPRALNSFKVLTFDVVGTLIDFEKGLSDGLQAIASEASVTVDGEEALSIYRECRCQEGAGCFPDDLARCYGVVAEMLGLPQGKEYGRQMVEAVGNAPAFPDSAEALARLAERYKLVAMTNAQSWAFDNYQKKLGMPFHKGFTVDDTGVEKPDPVFFEHVFTDLIKEGVEKGDILHVAQSQYHDIGISRRLGMTNCWIERRHDKAGYGGTISPDSFTEPSYHFTTLAGLADAITEAT